jgi:hypothetical protein
MMTRPIRLPNPTIEKAYELYESACDDSMLTRKHASGLFATGVNGVPSPKEWIDKRQTWCERWGTYVHSRDIMTPMSLFATSDAVVSYMYFMYKNFRTTASYCH